MLSSLERWQESSVYWVQKQNLVGNLLLHLLHKLSVELLFQTLSGSVTKILKVQKIFCGVEVWPWFLTFWQINQKEFFSTSSQHADPWCHNYLLARIMVIAVDITRYCFTPRWERRKLLKSPFQVVLDPFSNFRSCYTFWSLTTKEVEFLDFQVFSLVLAWKFTLIFFSKFW